MAETGNNLEIYRDVCTKSMNWLLSNINQFELPKDTNSDNLLNLLKPIGELATTADIVSAATAREPNLGRFTDDVIGFCWEQLEEGDVLVNVLNKRIDLIALLTMYPLFYKRGLRNQELESLVDRFVNYRAVRALELTPWRKIEMNVTLIDLGREPLWDSEKAFNDTWIASCPEPWIIGDGPAYSVTHTIFYMTQFGANPEQLPGWCRDYVAKWAPCWAWYFYQIDNFDLYCEMLMVLRCLREPDKECWARMLHAVQSDDGSVHGPYPVSQSLDCTTSDETRMSFLDHYHTTLVSVMACSMAMSFGC